MLVDSYRKSRAKSKRSDSFLILTFTIIRIFIPYSQLDLLGKVKIRTRPILSIATTILLIKNYAYQESWVDFIVKLFEMHRLTIEKIRLAYKTGEKWSINEYS